MRTVLELSGVLSALVQPLRKAVGLLAVLPLAQACCHTVLAGCAALLCRRWRCWQRMEPVHASCGGWASGLRWALLRRSCLA